MTRGHILRGGGGGGGGGGGVILPCLSKLLIIQTRKACVITPRACAARGYVIGRGVYIIIVYIKSAKKFFELFSIFQNTHFQTPISTQEGFS